MEPTHPLGVLNHDPLVIYATVDSFHPPSSNLLARMASVGRRPFTLVVQVERSLRHLATNRPALLEAIAREVRQHERAHPTDRVWLACRSPAEVTIAEQRGLRAAPLHAHAFLNDTPFSPRPLVPKQYDALLVAAARPRERPGLAGRVEGLAVAPLHTAATPEAGAMTKGMIKSLLPQARHLPAPARPAELATLIGLSRVGLCLGDHEDPSFFPLQCWLSGVPMVMTALPAAGEPMWEPTRAVPCADTPAGVANAVSIALARDFDPLALRRAVLTRLWTFRNDWRAFIARVCAAMENPTGNLFEEQFKALRAFNTGANLRGVTELQLVLAAGSGVAAPAAVARKPRQ